MKQLKGIGFAVLYFVIALAMQFVVMFEIIIQTAMKRIPMNSIMDFFGNMEKDYKSNLVLISAINLIYIVGFGVWYVMIRKRRDESFVDYKKIVSGKSLICMAVMAICAQYCCNFVLVGVKLALPNVFENYLKLVEGLDIRVMPAWIMVLIVAIWAPLAEEVIFRAMIFRTLRKGFSFVPAAVISGVLFGVYHMNLVQGIYASALGVLLAYTYEKTNSLLGCYLYHFLFNLSSYGLETVQKLIPLPETIWGMITLGATVLAVPALVCMIWWFGKIYRGERKEAIENENI